MTFVLYPLNVWRTDYFKLVGKRRKWTGERIKQASSFRGSDKPVNKLVGEKHCEGDLLFSYSKESYSLPGVIILRFPVLTNQKCRSQIVYILCKKKCKLYERTYCSGLLALWMITDITLLSKRFQMAWYYFFFQNLNVPSLKNRNTES